jgi:hypothetical protein
MLVILRLSECQDITLNKLQGMIVLHMTNPHFPFQQVVGTISLNVMTKILFHACEGRLILAIILTITEGLNYILHIQARGHCTLLHESLKVKNSAFVNGIKCFACYILTSKSPRSRNLEQ